MNIYKFHTVKAFIIKAIFLSIYINSNSVNAEVLIVVSDTSPFISITKNQAQKIWLGKKKRLNNLSIIVLDQNIGKTQTEFYKSLLGKTPNEVIAYWKKLVFSEIAYPPTQLLNDEQVKEWLNLNPLSIGYIDSRSLDKSVRVLLKINSLNEEN